jgi:hypothetical protein
MIGVIEAAILGVVVTAALMLAQMLRDRHRPE